MPCFVIYDISQYLCREKQKIEKRQQQTTLEVIFI